MRTNKKEKVRYFFIWGSPPQNFIISYTINKLIFKYIYNNNIKKIRVGPGTILTNLSKVKSCIDYRVAIIYLFI